MGMKLADLIPDTAEEIFHYLHEVRTMPTDEEIERRKKELQPFSQALMKCLHTCGTTDHEISAENEYSLTMATFMTIDDLIQYQQAKQKQ